jgi:L-amino acid N-acyltransferase YncA
MAGQEQRDRKDADTRQARVAITFEMPPGGAPASDYILDSEGDTAMEKEVRLKDQTEVLIREMTRDDLDRSLAFFRSLPEDDRAYLRRDVTKQEVVERRIAEQESGAVMRLIAVADGQIVADGSLEIPDEDWKKHVGELRLIVGRHYQRKGLGTLMARELYLLAAASKMEEIIVMRPQKAARSIFRRLGFRKEASLHDYVQDQAGGKQDLILMRCDLEALWRKMEDFLSSTDWERAR